MIEVKTVYDIEAQKKVSRFTLKRTILNPVNFVAYPLVLIFGIVFCIISVNGGNSSDLYWGIFFIAGAFLFPALVFFVTLFSTKSIEKSNRQLKSQTNTHFRFEKDTFYAEYTRNGEVTGLATINYSELFKAMETKTDFFLYTHKTSLIVVPKADIVSGTPEELREILKTSLGKRYKS